MNTLLFWDKSNITIITSIAVAKYSLLYVSFIHTESELFAVIEDENWRVKDDRKLLVCVPNC